ncbi:hypothetical protein D8674_030533 [Pyrus ussuriensis x Pyrus communis]|uniref:RNase H type-1 domain-containing protein n=1 Tax=Pyrus ussuriensis x Pyrus communis TaxID=2448454 RepID=A0A5N5EX17_9ROSA|nr:hypothetical protein D8674_030533 [Pyrus ussuriensis x Pyrus communis]
MSVMVDALIDVARGAWKEDLIQKCFDEEKGNIILGLPVSLMGCPDRVIWHYSNNGAYTVCTGYGVAMENEENEELGGVYVGKGYLAEGLFKKESSFAGQRVRWKRPPYGVLKINCDGAWCGRTCKGGYGWVLRDFAGLLQAGEYVIDAILECFIHDIGCLVSQLGRVRFVFVKWNGNAATHAVASYVASHGGVFRWNAFGPKFLFNILAQDVNVSVRI